jgi:threonine dehydratase
MSSNHKGPSVAAARSARARLAGTVLRSPLVRLNLDAPAEIYLKLETLQAVGSFKIRGAANLLARLDGADLRDGVWTASAGNMARAVAWCARERGIPCTVVVPEGAPEAKLGPVRELGATVIPVSSEEFFETFSTRRRPGMTGTFVHAFSDADVMAGNGTIGLEILEDQPDIDSILVSCGGGGLSCGIASVVKELAPHVKVFACEPDTAAPMTASLAARTPVAVEYRRTFIDGAGGARVYPEMLELALEVLDGGIAVPVEAVAEAVRLLATANHVVSEGAGALPVAAALRAPGLGRRVCCVVSGGNIDPAALATILNGQPQAASLS